MLFPGILVILPAQSIINLPTTLLFNSNNFESPLRLSLLYRKDNLFRHKHEDQTIIWSQNTRGYYNNFSDIEFHTALNEKIIIV
jgi:hypothetical protein